MTRRQKTRISYVIRDSYDSNQHRQGINVLKVDYKNRLLYSGGRDAMVKKWDLNESSIQISQPDPMNLISESLHTFERGTLDENGISAKISTEPLDEKPLLDTFDWHSDWVNDIALLKEEGHSFNLLISPNLFQRSDYFKMGPSE